MKLKLSTPLLTVTITVWLLLSLLALGWVEKSDGAAGTASHPPLCFQPIRPSAAGLRRPALVMLLHPRCPCSRASLSELSRLMALCPGKAAVSVLLLRPPGCPRSFTDTGLRRQAAAIPGVSVADDTDGAAAKRYGAATSGETLLYAYDGRLLYHGGLTGARGHEGDNCGLAAVAALLDGRAAPSQAPVYGCPLTADRRECAEKHSTKPGGAAWLP